MKIFLTFFLLFFNLVNTKAQFYQLFFFHENKPFVYDTVLQKIANEASAFYYSDNFDSSIVSYGYLHSIKPNFKLEYNIAVLYAINNKKDSAIVYLSKYIDSEEKCECAYLNNSAFKLLKVYSEFELIKNKCDSIQKHKGIKNISLYNNITYLYGKDQEILGASAYKDIKEERRELMNSFFAIIDSVGIPHEEDITQTGINYFQILLLHSDLFPNKQITIASKILKSKKFDKYNKKQLAYTIDRGYCNLNQPQLYGTILTTNPFTKNSCLYQYDNFIKLSKRREKMDFQPISDFLENKSILK
ncbi:MAG: hypothetical protein H6586_03905 [Flavobacteriales bacterium]|nr:hypothetical protein [Flavobacteriales bacterium]